MFPNFQTGTEHTRTNSLNGENLEMFLMTGDFTF